MGKINIVINGQKTTGDPGETILETAEHLGIHIPTLCHREELKPSGVCRLCVVEVKGSPRLVASCHTPISEDMVIHTDSPKVLMSRRITLELLLAGHTGPCVVDPDMDECELHEIASRVELGPPRFTLQNCRSYPVEGENPYIIRDLSRCILCRRCVTACNEIARKAIFSVGYRGSEAKIIVGMDGRLDTDICKDCGICVDFCPTSALRRATNMNKKSTKEKQAPSQRNANQENILAELRKEQLKSGFVSEEAMKRLEEQFATTLGDIYGITSFYSFLSTKPMGRNVIRVCRSLPCFLKNGPMLLDSIQKAINILPGETTSDGRFSLELANCIGACDQAPAIMVNHDIHGRLTKEDIPGILASYK